MLQVAERGFAQAAGRVTAALKAEVESPCDVRWTGDLPQPEGYSLFLPGHALRYLSLRTARPPV